MTALGSDKPIFIVIPRKETDHPRVEDTVIYQGRVHLTPFLTPRPLARLKFKNEEMNGEPDTLEAIVKKLIAHVVPESKEYLMTDAGKAEIEMIADFILRNRT